MVAPNPAAAPVSRGELGPARPRGKSGAPGPGACQDEGPPPWRGLEEGLIAFSKFPGSRGGSRGPLRRRRGRPFWFGAPRDRRPRRPGGRRGQMGDGIPACRPTAPLNDEPGGPPTGRWCVREMRGGGLVAGPPRAPPAGAPALCPRRAPLWGPRPPPRPPLGYFGLPPGPCGTCRRGPGFWAPRGLCPPAEPRGGGGGPGERGRPRVVSEARGPGRGPAFTRALPAVARASGPFSPRDAAARAVSRAGDGPPGRKVFSSPPAPF